MTHHDYTPACETVRPEIAETRRNILPYLRRRGEDPLFVLASGVMHGGPFNYEYQQPFVEAIVRDGDPHNFTDPDRNEEFLRTGFVPGEKPEQIQATLTGKPAITPRKRTAMAYKVLSKRMAEAMKVYIKACGDDGVRCKEKNGQIDLMNRLRDVSGFKVAPKIRALMWEYFGDDDAVAVDRHVANWACKDARLVCAVDNEGNEIKWKKGDNVPQKMFDVVGDAVRDEAPKCEITAAELQVAAWTKGACRATGRKGNLYLGEGGSIPCGKFKAGKLVTL